jgi:tetratricopeptide (TPR) repeat protein
MPSALRTRVAVCCWGWLALGGAALAETPEAAPGPFELAFAEGVWEYYLGRDLEAERYFREALEASPAHPRIPLVRYWLGLTYLRQGRGEEALAQLEASLAAAEAPRVTTRRRLADLGAAQLAAGRAEEAAGTLARALDAGADDAPTLYRYAATLERLGRADDAEQSRARARGANPNLDPDIAGLPVPPPELEPADGREGAADRWSLRAALAAGTDSNPHLLDDELAILTPAGEVVRGEQADSVTSLDLEGFYAVPVGEGDWSAGASLVAGRTLHRDFEELDLGSLGVELRLTRDAEPAPGGRLHDPALAIGWRDYELDGEDYLRLLDASLTAEWRLRPAVTARTELRLLDRDYGDHTFADERRSGEEGSAALVGLFGRAEGPRRFEAGIAAGHRRAGVAFSHDFAELRLAGSVKLAPRWSGTSQVVWREERYDSPASDLFAVAGGERRRDRTLRGGATLDFRAARGLRVRAEARWTERDSNVEDSSGLADLGYRRWTAALGFAWSFGSTQ